MSAEELKALCRRANDEILNKGNLDLIDEIFATDYVFHGTKESYGRDSVKQGLAALRAAFPDLRVEVGEFVVEGDRIAWQRIHRGTHKGELWGIPATDKDVTWRQIIISRVVDGKVVEEWGVGDLQEQIR